MINSWLGQSLIISLFLGMPSQILAETSSTNYLGVCQAGQVYGSINHHPLLSQAFIRPACFTECFVPSLGRHCSQPALSPCIGLTEKKLEDHCPCTLKCLIFLNEGDGKIFLLYQPKFPRHAIPCSARDLGYSFAHHLFWALVWGHKKRPHRAQWSGKTDRS